MTPNHAETMAYPPGFPVRRVAEQSPNFGSHFFGGFNASSVNPIAQNMQYPNTSVEVTQGYRSPMSMGDNYLSNILGTNLGENMDDEVVEVAPPETMMTSPNEAEKTPKDGAVINKSVKKVNTLEKYFGKK